jgi:glucose-6-phosphate 1-epimerase
MTNQFHGCELTQGMQGLPKLSLTAPDGACAEVYLHGGHVTSWIPSGGEERLFLSQTSEFGPKSSIRGGVPVIFPQFSNVGPLPRHGFARRMDWTFLRAETGEGFIRAVLRLEEDEETLRIWPQSFILELAVTVGGKQLGLELSVTNRGKEAFTFTGALHTYLRVANIEQTQISGLERALFNDALTGKTQRQAAAGLEFRSEVDRVYRQLPDRVVVREPERELAVEMQGFEDTVVWNPWAEDGGKLADLEADGYLRFVCVEAALVEHPARVQPSETWKGMQRLTA